MYHRTVLFRSTGLVSDLAAISIVSSYRLIRLYMLTFLIRTYFPTFGSTRTAPSTLTHLLVFDSRVGHLLTDLTNFFVILLIILLYISQLVTKPLTHLLIVR